MKLNDHFKRIHSLSGSLECVLSAMELAEDNSTCTGAAIFLISELKDAIEAAEGLLTEAEGEDRGALGQ